MTSPADAASTGVPVGAAMSMPSWGLPQRVPKSELKRGEATGQRNGAFDLPGGDDVPTCVGATGGAADWAEAFADGTAVLPSTNTGRPGASASPRLSPLISRKSSSGMPPCSASDPDVSP